MSLTENQPVARPPAPPFQRRLLRLTGAFAMLLFLTPTAYVLKYYTVDQPRETARAALISTVPLAPTVPLDTIAPPFSPANSQNAAAFYCRAIQSFADQAHHLSALPAPTLPLTPGEATALQQGAHCTRCRFFVADASGQPSFTFHDPDQNGAPTPYRFPVTAQEKYRYLSAAVGLAEAMVKAANAANPAGPDRARIGGIIIRFGEGIGNEEATYTHVQVALIIKRLGLGLLPPQSRGLQAYVDAQERYKEAIEAKYALLEVETPDNLPLQAKVAEHDTDPMWRREAVWAIGESLAQPGVNWHRPLETLTAKATLAQVAASDPDASVRAAAAQTLAQVAQHGAVIRR